MRYLVLALVLSACGDDTSAPPGLDGSADAPAPDAPQSMIDAEVRDGMRNDAGHCTGDAGMGGSNVIYLNFDGVTLIADSRANDARTNHTYFVQTDKTVPPFLNGMAGRDAVITTIVNTLQQEFGIYDVELTRTRPASGDYMMVVFGGDSASILGTAGYGGYASIDCDDLDKVDLMLVFDSTNAVGTANVAMFDLGLSIGLSVSTRSGDCMARQPLNTACALSADSPVEMGMGGMCPGAGATQDELAAFGDALGCR